MKTSQHTIDALASYGAFSEHKKNKVIAKCDLGPMLKINQWALSVAACDTSREIILSLRNSDNDRFAGGSMEDLDNYLSGQINMAKFNSAYDKFRQGKLASKIKARLAEIQPQRKRKLSEHDGDWDYDRRYEIAPFSSTTKILAPAKMIKVYAAFSISAYANADDINQYGAMVWSLCRMLEQARIPTEIILTNDCTEVNADRDLNRHVEITLKKAGQYISPSLLAAAFSSLFYRRAMFQLFAVLPGIAGKSTSAGLGVPVKKSKAVEFKNGEIHINTIDAASGYTQEVEKAVLQALA